MNEDGLIWAVTSSVLIRLIRLVHDLRHLWDWTFDKLARDLKEVELFPIIEV